MSKFPMIEKIGLSVFGMDVIKAEDLESILQSAQVVYGHVKQDMPHWWGPRENGQFDDTHTALVIGITPLKKKTKAEAALELLQEMSKIEGYENWYTSAAKRILEMKDEV